MKYLRFGFGESLRNSFSCKTLKRISTFQAGLTRSKSEIAMTNNTFEYILLENTVPNCLSASFDVYSINKVSWVSAISHTAFSHALRRTDRYKRVANIHSYTYTNTKYILCKTLKLNCQCLCQWVIPAPKN